MNTGKDRITASKFKDATNKISDNYDIINSEKSRTVIANVCGYYSRYESKATRWGLMNEHVARKLYIKLNKSNHRDFIVVEPGFYIDIDNPFIGASPDGLVNCSCHEPGLLEIKCPWTFRALTIEVYTSKKDSCLVIKNGHIQLKRNHAYYYQIQCQMLCTGRKWCDFFLCTTRNSFLEKIPYDISFMEVAIKKAKLVYEALIMPEIFSRSLKVTLEIEKHVKETMHDIINIVCDGSLNTLAIEKVSNNSIDEYVDFIVEK